MLGRDWNLVRHAARPRIQSTCAPAHVLEEPTYNLTYSASAISASVATWLCLGAV